MRKLPVFFVTCLLLLSSAGLCWAAAVELRGIDNVQVLIEGLEQAARSGGLTEDDLQAVVELKLQVADISIVNDGPTGIYVNLQAIDNQKGAIVYHLNLWVWDSAILYRDKRIYAPMAVTWQEARFDKVPVDRFRSGVRDTLSELMDMLLNDHLEANPRRR